MGRPGRLRYGHLRRARCARARGQGGGRPLHVCGDDRGEVLATAIAALNLGIPIAHIQGGDVSGNIDECMRHAITKLSHIHFSSTQESAGRIKTMGEEAWRIFIVGDNHVDPIVSKDYSDAKTVRAKFAIPDFEKPILVLIHPETFRIRDGYGDAKCVLEPVLELGRRTILVYPCSDQGYEAIVRALEEVAHYPNVSLHKNIDTPDFHGLMAISSFLIGNSSAGLIEAPYFPLPAIDVGERQIGRMRAENVIHCDFDRTEIIQSLDIVLNNDVFARRMANCSRPFGDGKAYMSIVEHLKTTPLGTALIQKKFASL